MKAVNLELLLPADFQPGERVLWHGRPQWISMARRAFRVDLIAMYFGLMTVWNVTSTAMDAGAIAAAISGAKTMGAGLLAVMMLAFLAFLSARTSLYVVTTKRVVMKAGIALPIFFNLPFNSINAASVRVYSDGTGEIPLALEPNQHIAYLHLWPHAKPFRINRPEPSLRSVPDAAKVAEILSRALILASNESQSTTASFEKTTPIRTPDRHTYTNGSIAAA